jgi:hypothetical protein
MDSPADFPLFVELPTELRLKIWQLTIPEPRVVPVRYNRSSRQYTSTGAPPVAAHICSESRTLFLESYTKLILSPKYESAVFVDFACDTIYFDHLDCSPDGDLSFDLAISPHRDRILKCAINSELWEILRVFRYDSLSEVKLMPNLKTIALVMSKNYEIGTPQRHMSEDGRQTILMESGATTVESGIRHIFWYVQTLKMDLKHSSETEKFWGDNLPHAQMWLW